MKRTLTLAVTAALALGAVAAEGAGELQTIETFVTPTKLDRKKFEPATVFVDIFTANNDESTAKGEQPPSATRVRVDLPRNLRFDPSAVPRCDVGSGELEGKTAAEQENLCGRDSKVSLDNGSSAQVTFDPTTTPLGPAGDSRVFPVAVQAFNGREPESLYLATDPDGFITTPVIVGRFTGSDSGRAFGRQLDLAVPGLAYGAFSDLKLTLASPAYLKTRCRSTTNRFRVRSDYSDHSATVVDDESLCKQKKKKKKKKKK